MLRITPLKETDASPDIQATYQKIKQTLHTPVVPLIFQYLARFPDYFLYLWEKIDANVNTASFKEAQTQIEAMADSITSIIYTPSNELATFAAHLQHEEKEQLINTVNDLRNVNATLTILTIAIRESMKGLPIGEKKLEYETKTHVQSDDTHMFESILSNDVAAQQENKLTDATRLLMPIFGSQALVISKYPDFFSLIAKEMENLVKNESYLKGRVGIEQIAHVLIMSFTSSFRLTYKETVAYLFDKPYNDELLYLLKDAFPSQFPRLLITTSVMHKTLNPANSETNLV